MIITKTNLHPFNPTANEAINAEKATPAMPRVIIFLAPILWDSRECPRAKDVRNTAREYEENIKAKANLFVFLLKASLGRNA